MENTELYQSIINKLFESGLSKRQFADKYGLNHAWLIEFTNANKKFRPLQIKSMSLLHRTLDIPYEIMEDYNKKVLEMRNNVSM